MNFSKFELQILLKALNDLWAKNEKSNYAYALSVDHLAERIQTVLQKCHS